MVLLILLAGAPAILTFEVLNREPPHPRNLLPMGNHHHKRLSLRNATTFSQVSPHCGTNRALVHMGPSHSILRREASKEAKRRRTRCSPGERDVFFCCYSPLPVVKNHGRKLEPIGNVFPASTEKELSIVVTGSAMDLNHTWMVQATSFVSCQFNSSFLPLLCRISIYANC